MWRRWRWCFWFARRSRRKFFVGSRPPALTLSNPNGVKWIGGLLNAYRSALLVTVAALISILGVFQPLAFGNSQEQEIKDIQIEVRLIPKQRSIEVGEVLEVRVEIRNVSSKPLF